MTESKICPECFKEFFQLPEDIKGKSFRVKKYCCKECCDKHNKRGNSHKTYVCIWCHKPFESTGTNARFCCAEERGFYYQKRRAIYALYPWCEDVENRDKELAKLKTQGKDYVLPKGSD